MKFETLILRSLFVACMLVCGLTLAAMITTKPTLTQLAASGPANSLLISATSTCTLPGSNNMACFRAQG